MQYGREPPFRALSVTTTRNHEQRAAVESVATHTPREADGALSNARRRRSHQYGDQAREPGRSTGCTTPLQWERLYCLGRGALSNFSATPSANRRCAIGHRTALHRPFTVTTSVHLSRMNLWTGGACRLLAGAFHRTRPQVDLC